MTLILPVSAIIPTMNRSAILSRLLNSIAAQSAQPAEVIVVDASSDSATQDVCRLGFSGLRSVVCYHRAKNIGAASQRNEAISYVANNTLLFFDDDVLLEADCLHRLWQALNSDDAIGGVNAMITNQKYSSPGLLSRLLFRTLHGRGESSYAGRCIGPALNLLPQDEVGSPEVVRVEWLNLGCTLYRREALPSPPFAEHFTGYSLMEDLALSLVVGKTWELANARTARIFHDSQPGEHKSSSAKLAEMELVNRYYVMSRILNRNGASDFAKLCLLELFNVVTPLVSPSAWKTLPAVIAGKTRGLFSILKFKTERRNNGLVDSNTNQVVAANSTDNELGKKAW